MPTEEPPNGGATTEPTSRPDGDTSQSVAAAYKAGYDDGHRVGYWKGKRARWNSLLLCLAKHRSDGDEHECQCLTTAMRCLLRVERLSVAEKDALVRLAQEVIPEEEVVKLVKEATEDPQAAPEHANGADSSAQHAPNPGE